MTARHDIPEAEFPDYVKRMHQDGDKKFIREFQVSTMSTGIDRTHCMSGVCTIIICSPWTSCPDQPVRWHVLRATNLTTGLGTSTPVSSVSTPLLYLCIVSMLCC